MNHVVCVRRQDIRILNARNRRLMDKKLIVFLASTAATLVTAGAASLAACSLHWEHYTHVRPLIVIGNWCYSYRRSIGKIVQSHSIEGPY